MRKYSLDWFSPLDCVGSTQNVSSHLGSKKKPLNLSKSSFDESRVLWVKEYEEGDRCSTEDCLGRLTISEPDNCSCHINPPCSACMSTYLECKDCGWEAEFDGEGKDR